MFVRFYLLALCGVDPVLGVTEPVSSDGLQSNTRAEIRQSGKLAIVVSDRILRKS